MSSPSDSDPERVACPCCGFLTLRGRAQDEICKVCFWHDDGQDEKQADEVWGGPNGILSLTQARWNYATYGAVEQRFTTSVRPPRDEEKPHSG
jgi:Cysteine-rich CPCC